MLFKKLKIILLMSFLLLLSIFPINALDVLIGGEAIGIVLKYDGVCITGFYDITVDNEIISPSNYFKINDIITHINNNRIDSIDQLCNEIKQDNDNNIEFTINRNNKDIQVQMNIYKNNDDYSTGLYVKDSTSGIGTVTYYQLDTGKFASLGHKMADYDFNLSNGNIYNACITGIKKNESNTIGQKIGNIDNKSIGIVEKECDFGIYGKITNIPKKDIYKTVSQDEIKLGDAYFLTVLKDNKIKKCNIRITNIDKQDSPKEKGIQFVLTDKDILKETNGIIQGMSGSPIIQDGKLIGAITHACSTNPAYGYGIFIENMLNAAS